MSNNSNRKASERAAKKIKDHEDRDDNDDCRKPLQEIATHHGKSVISLLLDIQTRQVAQQKFFRFVKSLECLYLDRSYRQTRQCDGLQHGTHPRRTRIRRCWINALKHREFVVVSYIRKLPGGGKYSKLKYEVERRSRKRFDPSPVRDVIWDRIFRYMRIHKVRLVWIDQHCIAQRQCKDNYCACKVCKRKRASLQTMDLVYKRSAHPVALLERCISSSEELHLLEMVLRGKLVQGNKITRTFRLSETTSLERARKALRLLVSVIKDRWWTRAWPFQENYVARERMTLLMPHAPHLETLKRECRFFGVVPDELCIRSVNFHREASRLCLALQEHGVKGVDRVLKAAGEYRVLLKSSDSMTASVIKDVQRRRAKFALDRLSIIANCC